MVTDVWGRGGDDWECGGVEGMSGSVEEGDSSYLITFDTVDRYLDIYIDR